MSGSRKWLYDDPLFIVIPENFRLQDGLKIVSIFVEYNWFYNKLLIKNIFCREYPHVQYWLEWKFKVMVELSPIT